MIFVILGTEKFPFNRLVKEVDILTGNNTIGDSVFMQIGSCTYEPIHCRWERFLSFGDMCKKIEEADLIITHAGAGTTLLCLQYGKKPILMPRQKEFKEHVDNHQVVFAEKMQEKNLADVVLKTGDLAKIISVDKDKTKKQKRLSIKIQSSELTKYLNELLDFWGNITAK